LMKDASFKDKNGLGMVGLTLLAYSKLDESFSLSESVYAHMNGNKFANISLAYGVLMSFSLKYPSLMKNPFRAFVNYSLGNRDRWNISPIFSVSAMAHLNTCRMTASQSVDVAFEAMYLLQMKDDVLVEYVTVVFLQHLLNNEHRRMRYSLKIRSILHSWLYRYEPDIPIYLSIWTSACEIMKFDDVLMHVYMVSGCRPHEEFMTRFQNAFREKNTAYVDRIITFIPDQRMLRTWFGDCEIECMIVDYIWNNIRDDYGHNEVLFMMMFDKSQFYKLKQEEVGKLNLQSACEKVAYLKALYEESINKVHVHSEFIPFCNDLVINRSDFEDCRSRVIYKCGDKLPTCPITNDYIMVPVATKPGRFYERDAIISWLMNSDGRDPCDPSHKVTISDLIIPTEEELKAWAVEK
jgi:hypothetical protein